MKMKERLFTSELKRGETVNWIWPLMQNTGESKNKLNRGNK